MFVTNFIMYCTFLLAYSLFLGNIFYRQDGGRRLGSVQLSDLVSYYIAVQYLDFEISHYFLIILKVSIDKGLFSLDPGATELPDDKFGLHPNVSGGSLFST